MVIDYKVFQIEKMQTLATGSSLKVNIFEFYLCRVKQAEAGEFPERNFSIRANCWVSLDRVVLRDGMTPQIMGEETLKASFNKADQVFIEMLRWLK